jgi:bacterioferritin
MKGDAKVIALLNQVLRKELTGINQYFVHAKMCANWGYDTLARHARHESIDEMKHADRVIERILFLEGTPNMAAMDKMTIGSDVRAQLKSDQALELAALAVLRPGIETCLAACATPSDQRNGVRELPQHDGRRRRRETLTRTGSTAPRHDTVRGTASAASGGADLARRSDLPIWRPRWNRRTRPRSTA